MSDLILHTEPGSFFDLYCRGEVEPDAIDDWIGRWHDGLANGQALHTFLGLSLPEYQVWVYDADVLPCLRAARLAGRCLYAAVAEHLADVTAADGAADPAVVNGLRRWLDARMGQSGSGPKISAR